MIELCVCVCVCDRINHQVSIVSLEQLQLDSDHIKNNRCIENDNIILVNNVT